VTEVPGSEFWVPRFVLIDISNPANPRRVVFRLRLTVGSCVTAVANFVAPGFQRPFGARGILWVRFPGAARTCPRLISGNPPGSSTVAVVTRMIAEPMKDTG